MLNRVIHALITTIAVCILVSSAWGQSQVSSADLKGVVYDANGAVVPGATVTATNVDKGTPRTVQANERGEYSIPLLQPGVYDLKAEGANFSPQVVKALTLTVGQLAVYDFKLTAGGTKAEIQVSGSELPLIESENTVQASTVNQRQIQDLPINGRNFLDFTLLTPGVTSSNFTNSKDFVLPQVQQSGLSFGGQSGRSNNVTIDGADNNDYGVNSVRETITQEAVQEFQVVRNSASAEFGRSSGGAVNIVTKSGTNDFHFGLFGFFRDRKLDARNAFAFNDLGQPVQPPFSRWQYGASVGGPIVKDHTFFFAAYERQDLSESTFDTFLLNPVIFQPTGAQNLLVNFLQGSPNPLVAGFTANFAPTLVTSATSNAATFNRFRSESGAFPTTDRFHKFIARVDHTFSNKDSLNARFNSTERHQFGTNFGGLNGFSHASNVDSNDYTFAASEIHSFSSATINEFRFQYASDRYNVLPETSFGPAFVIEGVATLGRDNNVPSLRREQRFQLSDNINHTIGNHRLKAGFDFNYLKFGSDTEIFLGGSFEFAPSIPNGAVLQLGAGQSDAALHLPAGTTFNSILTDIQTRGGAQTLQLLGTLQSTLTSVQAFNFGIPVFYQQGFGNPNIAITVPVYAAYVQDSWKARSNLTIDYGLRYDYEAQPAPVHRDKNNFGPRLGFAWSPFNDQKTVVRGGYGIYYTPVFQAQAFIAKVLGSDGGIFQVFRTASNTIAGQPASAVIFQTLLKEGIIGTRTITAADLAQFGINPATETTGRVIFSSSPTFFNPYSHQASLGIEHQFGNDYSLSVNYLFNRGIGLISSRNVNARRLSAAEVNAPGDPFQLGAQQIGLFNTFGIPQFAPINPAILVNNQDGNVGDSYYHALTAQLTKRFSHHVQLGVAYTLSKTIDDVTDFFNTLQPQNDDDVRGERGLSSYDQRHRLVINAVIESPYRSSRDASTTAKILGDWNFAPIVTAASGRPFNILVGFDANRDNQSATDRPVGTPRNTGIGPNFFSFDARVSRRFRLSESKYIEGIFDGFNLFNRTNYADVNTVAGSVNPTVNGAPLGAQRVTGSNTISPSQFLGFTSALASRQLQLGVRFVF